jgi:hypothetical protein
MAKPLRSRVRAGAMGGVCLLLGLAYAGPADAADIPPKDAR